jgi:hypothetical protein
VPDTIQWWVASTGTWRIKTFAIDHDIHTFSVEGKDSLIELALANAQKHYGDVILSNHVIKLHDCRDPAEVIAAFRAEGLEPRLEIAEGRFAFWKPDDGKYHSQSQPR